MLLAGHGDRRVDGLTKKAARIAEARPHVGATASAMYNDLIRYMDGYDSINPFAKLVKEGQGRKHITPLTEAEVCRFGDIAVEEWGRYGACSRAWILFSAWTGCRPGEVAGLQPADLNFAAGLVHVQRQRRIDGVALPKTKETREIILPAAAAEVVRHMPTQGIEWVCATSSGHPFGKGSWNYYWRPVRDAFTRELPASHWLPQRLAIDPKDKLEIYELRHFCGSLLADRGATARDIAEQLGNTAEVCERTYIHPYQSRVRARLRAAFDQPHAPESADQFTRESGG